MATAEQIRQLLLQAAFYCGIPVAADSFRLSREIFEELGI